MSVLTFDHPSNLKLVLAIVLCLCLSCDARFKGFRRFGGPPEERQQAGAAAEVQEYWFTQKLDHFNGADTRVWKQVRRRQEDPNWGFTG